MAVHIYHYNTHAEKRYFLGREHRDLYNLVGLNGNIVSYSPGGVAAFVATSGKNFYIDPQTHAFQHATIHLKRDVSEKKAKEPPRYEFKPSIVKLATERLGSVFATTIRNDRPISVADLMDDPSTVRQTTVEEICQGVGTFQLNTLADSLDEEALELIDEETGFQPSFLIAPYFYLAPTAIAEWLCINEACYNAFKQLHAGSEVFMAVLAPRQTVRSPDVLIGMLERTKPDGVLLWIDQHNEEELEESDVKAYVDFLSKIRPNTGTVYNSHGGYLSTMMCHPDVGNLLNGLGHSMNYGEERSIVPIGGGIPMARFYLGAIHSRLRFGDAASIVQPNGWLDSSELYTDNVCACRQCRELIEKNSTLEDAFYEYGASKRVRVEKRSGTVVELEYPTPEAKQAATRHYLYNKAREFSNLGEYDGSQLRARLAATYREFADRGEEEFAAHLQMWHEGTGGLGV